MSDNRDDTERDTEQHTAGQDAPQTASQTPVSTDSGSAYEGGESPVQNRQQTLKDIEQDIADANFDLSDVQAFGDHDTPEVHHIHISEDAQSVLDKVQQQVGQDSLPKSSPHVEADMLSTTQTGGSNNDFITDNADKFKQAIHAHATGHSPPPPPPETSATPEADDTHLKFDFDLASIQSAQSPVKRSLLAMVFNFTIFMLVLMGVGAGGYYVYTQHIQVKPNAPVLLRAQADIKVKPTSQTGMKIENLDKDVYDILEQKNDLNAQVKRLRPPPEQPLQLPKSAPKPADKNLVPLTKQNTTIDDLMFTDPKNTLSNKGAVVEKLTLAPSNTEQTTEQTTKQTTEKTVEKTTEKMEKAEKVEKTEETEKIEKKAQVTIDNITQPKQKVAPPKNPVTKPATNPQNETVKAVPPPKKADTQQVDTDSQKILPFGVSDASDKQNLGWRVQVAALTNMADAEKTYKTVQKKYPFLQNVTFHVEKVMVKGTLYYRLQAIHFADKQSATALCRQIKQAKGACIVKK